MERSRRDVLRAGGSVLATAGVAGCIEERVTRRETRATDSATWTLSPADEGVALDAEGFGNYVERMRDTYGDSGVWGTDTERPETFGIAYAGRYAITRETPGNPTEGEFSLTPEAVDPEAPMLIADTCIVRYDLGDDRYRYWLWVAADPTDGRLVREVRLTTLSTGLRFGTGTVVGAATPTVGDGEGSVGFETPPSGTFPVSGGSIDTTAIQEAGGLYAVEWRGKLDATQSVNGVCTVERSGAYDVSWTMSLGYGFEEDV
ncbi:hypothetical protein [Natronomonas sp. LN261]|uniref:hypothetical protein n=1 Tax=Natronomonas sp. LN261 TaxID=2750669 RepID=UPI0015EEFC46|nr:hypothetical protein [Natronomonas sp. LN261]